MLTKRSLIVALVGLNLALLAALILSLDTLPRAEAQAAGGRPGDFAACTVKLKNDYDGLFIVDQSSRKLHLLVPSRQEGTLEVIQTRELDSDFRRTR